MSRQARREVPVQPHPRTSRRARIARILIVLTVALPLLGAFGVWWYVFERPDAPPVQAGTEVRVEVPEGASSADIGELLSAAGVVENAARFRFEVRLADADGELLAGSYDLVTGMGYSDAIAQLRQGSNAALAEVTVPEGWVIEQIAARFEEQAGIPAVEFETLARSGPAEFPRSFLGDVYEGSLEGYLFPKKYRVSEDATARDVIGMMLDQFETEIASIDLTPAYERGFTLHEVVTMASIIEREARLPHERELVSSVIHNRLERGMLLEIDATIEYLLPGTRFRLQNHHLDIDSPYNTYRNRGLPPGPIASPGLASLEAAVNPADTSYLYYVLTDP
ncbi:MAG: endolytic transglycosylase MltG, partial [Anaerosomatales bacterium]|nr:endolytic transglycosylase MltG [Anaerosomatales bacterium]